MSMSGRMTISAPVRRLELFIGSGWRRTWSQDERASIVAESEMSATSISAVARRHGLRVSQLFTWRWPAP
ncbi:MAG: transposase [Nitrospiraceae bacterium]|nr:transposase [Nitrospiraceae bacterium]